MSVEVENLSKSYGQKKVLEGIDFQIQEGQVVGLLGLNGAGKSTLMKVVAGFLSSDTGRVRVFGYELASKRPEYKSLIGYLPEHNPMYLEMYVREYLSFCARFYGLRKSRIEEVIEIASLTSELKKPLKSLSKGYRQRVGLAATILHKPKFLVLDEPTSGLDFDQLIAIRKLIKSFSADSIVLLSSHIMEEIKEVCDRILALKNGRIIIDQDAHQVQMETVIEEMKKSL